MLQHRGKGTPHIHVHLPFLVLKTRHLGGCLLLGLGWGCLLLGLGLPKQALGWVAMEDKSTDFHACVYS